MRRIITTITALTAALALAVPASAAKPADTYKDVEGSIVDTAVALNGSGPYAGVFDTLIAAVVGQGLAPVLDGQGQYTVFAPTDDAFAALGLTPDNVNDLDGLADVLAYHVARGERDSGDVIGSDRIRTLNGSSIDVQDELGGNLVVTDVETANGIIHVIDVVLLP